MLTRLAAILTALALMLPVTAPAVEPVPSKPTITKTFAVADLVIPIPDVGDDPGPISVRGQHAAVTDGADKLMKLVTCLIRPNSWAAMGGQGTVEFFSTGHVLVVKNSAEVVTEVADLLQAMRRLQDVSVVTEVRLVTVPAGFCKRVGVNRDGGAGLTEREVKRVPGSRAVGPRSKRHAIAEGNDLRQPDRDHPRRRTAHVRHERRGGQGEGAAGSRPEAEVGRSRRHAHAVRPRLGRPEVHQPPGESVADIRGRGCGTGPRHLDDPAGLRGRIAAVNRFPSRSSSKRPNFRTQSIVKTVVVPDGGTVVLGGWNETTRSAPCR